MGLDVPDTARLYLRVLLLTASLWWGLYACGIALDPGAREHFLGTSDKQAIDVLAVEALDGDCGRHRTRYELTYRVVGSETTSRHVECSKGPREVGRHDVWRAGDDLDFDSPMSERLWMLAVPFLFAGAVTWQRSRGRRGSSD